MQTLNDFRSGGRGGDRDRCHKKKFSLFGPQNFPFFQKSKLTQPQSSYYVKGDPEFCLLLQCPLAIAFNKAAPPGLKVASCPKIQYVSKDAPFTPP